MLLRSSIAIVVVGITVIQRLALAAVDQGPACDIAPLCKTALSCQNTTLTSTTSKDRCQGKGVGLTCLSPWSG